MSEPIQRYRQTGTDTCTVKDCDRDHIARGLCRKHYNEYRRSGKFKRAPQPPAVCVVPWCDAQTIARGLCYTHYNKWNQRRRRGWASESGAALHARGPYVCHTCGRLILDHDIRDECA